MTGTTYLQFVCDTIRRKGGRVDKITDTECDTIIVPHTCTILLMKKTSEQWQSMFRIKE